MDENDMDENDKVREFRAPAGFYCPSCGGTSYEPLTIPSGGRDVPTGVYRCNSCSFGFLNPSRYSKRQPRST